MANADDPIAESLRQACWRQGDLIPPKIAATLLNKSVDLCQVTASDQTWLIILTQDCDILRDIHLEPYIECIVAQEVGKANPQLEAGQSTRRIHLPAGTYDRTIWFECSIHHRFRLPKESLAEINPQTDTTIAENSRRQLRQWVARRYTRRPFPDAFEQRLNPRQGAIRNLFKDSAAKLISTVFIQTNEEELPESEPYKVDILLVARDRDLADPDFVEPIEDFEQKVLDAFEAKEGIEFHTDSHGNQALRVIGEDSLTIGMIRRYKRFDADYRSSDDNEASPADGIDET